MATAAADSRESTWIRLEIRERIRACARECPCEIAVPRPRRVALCTAPPRPPRSMAFQRSWSRVAQLDPLAWIIESRSITTPRSIVNPAPSNLIRVWPTINRPLHFFFDQTHFSTPFSPIVDDCWAVFPTYFATNAARDERFFLAIIRAFATFRLYSEELKYAGNIIFVYLCWLWRYCYLYIFMFQFYCFKLKEKDSIWITRVDSRLKMMTMIDFRQYSVTTKF